MGILIPAFVARRARPFRPATRGARRSPPARDGGASAIVARGGAIFLLCFAFASAGRAEDGYELWLRYRPEPDAVRRAEYAAILGGAIAAPARPVVSAARDELGRYRSAAFPSASTEAKPDALAEARVHLGTRADDPAIAAQVSAAELAPLGDEGFVVRVGRERGREVVVVAGNTDRGVLYGTFALLRFLQQGKPLSALPLVDRPRVAVRMANHWDNPVATGSYRGESIERGYAGDSFFDWSELPVVSPRVHDWARLLAAMGVNGVVVNNVNTAKKGLEGWRLLTTPYLPKVAALAGALRPYGVRLYLSVNFFSPVLIDRLPTADPLDPAVRAWWQAKADEIYAAIPDFGGFLVKADSEGEPGPMKYGRTHADGANVIAAALAPHGGRLQWRAFVYDRTTGDRVTQAYTNFQPLDGRFAANAAVQVKNGPLDFQVREPVSSLLGALPRTPTLLELQITQEYTGQNRHVCFLGALWEEVLAFDTHADGAGATVAKLIEWDGNGIAGVMNTGAARNWTGALLAQANTYAYGRLAWDPALRAADLAREWSELTFGRDPQVTAVVTRILLDSWPAYENYTAPLGLGHLTRRGDHFAPDPANRTDYHHADAQGVGFDRTVQSGTGYAGQYHEPWRSRFESAADCPEDLLLFFHHVPYTWKLHNGRTLLQEIYARHDAGAARAQAFVTEWQSLRGKIDDERFASVLAQLQDQAALADEWRRTINGYFEQLSGVAPASTP